MSERNPAIPVTEGRQPLAVPEIRETIRRTLTRTNVPRADLLDMLAEMLRDHVGALMHEPLTDDAGGELGAMLKEADLLVRTVYPGTMTQRVDRWSYAKSLAYVAQGLLRCYEAATRP